MTSGVSTDAKSFLRSFFHPDYNGITREDVRQSTELLRLVEPLLVAEPRSAVLPWRKPTSDKKHIDYWFALARSASSLYTLRAELQAFVGKTFARIEGGRLTRKEDSPFASALHDFTNGYLFAFSGEDLEVLNGILRWLEVVAARPEREIPDTRSTGLLLRDFDAALYTLDRERARGILDFLRTDHRLDSRNLQFLELRLHAAFQEWSELLARGEIAGIVQLRRRPAAVTDDLLRAIYHVHLQEWVRQGDRRSLGTTLEEMAGTMAPLWSQRTGLQSVPAWLTYGLAVGLIEEDYEGVQAARLAVTQRGGDVSTLTHVLEQLQQPPSLPDDPRLAFMHRDYDRALELTRMMPEGAGRASLLVLLSRELGTLEVRQAAWGAVNDLEDDELTQFSVVERDALRTLESEMTPTEAGVEGWRDLLEELAKDMLSHAQVLRLAKSGHAEWTLNSLIGDPDALIEALIDIPDRRQRTLQDILTYIIDVLQDDAEYPDPALRDVYDILLLTLTSTRHPNPDRFYNVVDLLPGVLGTLTRDNYRVRFEDILKLLDRTTARLHPDRLLDFLDLLVASDCPDDGVRQSCFAFVERHRIQHVKQWKGAQWQFLIDLSREIDVSELIEALPSSKEAEPIDPLLRLEDKHVGVYTLTESAGRRFADILHRRVSEIKVSLNHAKVGTDRLKAVAKNADVLVIVAASAKHPATESITNNAREDTLIVWPQGKGSSSMLTALEEALEDAES